MSFLCFMFFTREYTQCTAGYTFCFVDVGVVVVATFSQTWHYFSRQWSDMIRNLIRHDQKHDKTWSDMIRRDQTWSDVIRRDQTWSDLKSVWNFFCEQPLWILIRHARQTCPADLPGSLAMTGKCSLASYDRVVLLWQGRLVSLDCGSIQ
jgi:hypothetical protein